MEETVEDVQERKLLSFLSKDNTLVLKSYGMNPIPNTHPPPPKKEKKRNKTKQVQQQRVNKKAVI